MAERFGGKFSPETKPGESRIEATPPANPFDGIQPARAGMRVNLLFLAPLPLIVRAFMMEATGLVQTLAGFGLLIAAAWLTREGETAHQEWAARKVARRPAFPRKIAGSILTGAGIFLACLPDSSGLVGPVLLGALGAALHLAAFGPDPMHDKGMEGIDSHSQDRAARAVEAAEAKLAQMKDAVLRAGDRRLEARVEAFQAEARKMFRTVEEDPRDLSAARKYLTVYLTGARDATIKFADLYARGRDPQARADYEALLNDLQQGFAQQTESLLSDNRDDLDVEISVLRERLEREGIRTG
ncbi:5-bromo-4-chloroindolyl phosphate hydrolysis family protein [Frigidibacter sp. ROC022]|uniref:5-bromo-4-chloroindolyl phosphate hydrolysis family protein n=1 Tax=Frigidibacter sp. ROC022 TaxID=2971796 RepID=UPI00215ADD25|nr:5-bromo-4-chloroindolyl phosphate hydrolysis family protein [Frigidibacter sp. ROC022]MCR8722882.1 5-bromo-4-chloroindolyl phosphate hydrolysis family protein [Frigidibacter sp. ROC022]